MPFKPLTSCCPAFLTPHPRLSISPTLQSLRVSPAMEGPIPLDDSSGPPLLPTASEQLPPAHQLHILSLLPRNDRALSGRLVSPDAAAGLSGPQHCTAFLSQPLPHHAVAWAVAAGQQHVRQLPFLHKVQLMCTAAASGSEVNLEVALALLQPSIFPEVLQGHCGAWPTGDGGLYLGETVAKAHHPHLLQWLTCHCPKLVECRRALLAYGGVLCAVARNCDLAGLQVAWEALSSKDSGGYWSLSQRVLDAAAESPTPDAVAKMEWVLQTAMNGAGGGRAEGGSCCRLQSSTAAAAARSGDLGRLRWLRDQGCPMSHGAGPVPVGEQHVLAAALSRADLTVAQWLVDEAGCELPGMDSNIPAEESDKTWTKLLRAAASSPDAVAKWQWLQERGGPSVAGAEPSLVDELVLAAVQAGRVAALQYLLSVLGPGKVLQVGLGALGEAVGRSGSIPVAECLQHAGLVFSHEAYGGAAGKLPFVRWLALEAKVSAAEGPWEDMNDMIAGWHDDTPAGSRDLLEAVQLLAGAGFCDWGGDVEGYAIGMAIDRGSLDLVLYLLQQGVPLDPSFEVIKAAAAAGCEPLLEFLAALPGCFRPSAAPTPSPYIKAVDHGDRATLDALRRLGVPWGGENVVAEAVKHRCGLPALRWLAENGAPVGSAEEMEDAVTTAVAGGSLGAEAAAWLRGLAAGGSGEGSDSED